MDIDVLASLIEKASYVPWQRNNRVEKYVLFSISGYTDELISVAKERGDVILM